MKKTLYEILGVSPSASDIEIQNAYKNLTQKLESGTSGLDSTEANFQLNLAKQAFWTLSDNMQRAAYDARLAKPVIETPDIEILLERKTRKSGNFSPRLLKSVIGGLIALGVTFQVVNSTLSRSGSQEMAEKKVALKEYELTYGTTSPSEIAAIQAREKEEQEQNEKMRETRKLEEEARKRDRQIEESRRYASDVSSDLQRSEERAERNAEYEKRRAEEIERAKLAQEQYKKDQQQRSWDAALGRKN
ncbi:MAG: DnaJ domain-containing protein [Sulfuricellaceae bacterium]|nr:DnaJ domain-containing protein [Sulfuricellaceae bacterium]